MESLGDTYGRREAENVTILIFEEVFRKNKVQLVLDKEENIKLTDQLLLEQYLDRLKKQEPVQHILGKTLFYGLEILVNRHTLIPRPETEELVKYILDDNQGMIGKKLLDVGTGSGCIVIAIAKNLPNNDFFAVDISMQALQVAQKNAQRLNVSVGIEKKDILSEELPQSYDIIVSNPPYIPYRDKQFMHENVINYEPGIALFVENENPLIFYKRLKKLAEQYLNLGGKLYCEIHESYGSALEEMGFEIHQDMQGKDRFAKWKR